MDGRVLKLAVSTAREVGELLRGEFSTGPVGRTDRAPIDTRVEHLIRERLLAGTPSFGFLGEETGAVAGDGVHVWVVDPHDGTSFYLRGARGPAVSIALLRDAVPVLGVVYAYAAPDHGGDLIAWCEGRPITRNNRVVYRSSLVKALASNQVVLASPAANIAPQAAADVVAPARYLVSPSIAYRLALVAVGDADAALSVAPLNSWDVAAGHALLRGAGASLVDHTGQEVTYALDGSRTLPACFAGAREVAVELSTRQIRGRKLREKAAPYTTLKPGENITDAGLLNRAQGCLLGQLTGDCLGSLVEFRTADDIAETYAHGPDRLVDGGTWNTLAGQLTDDSEMALTLARSIIEYGDYGVVRVREAYKGWFRSNPFDFGRTTATALGPPQRSGALGGPTNIESQANGALMRISPLGIFGALHPEARTLELARVDAGITHPHPLCAEANVALVAAIAYAIRTGASAAEVVAYAREVSGDSRLGTEPDDYQSSMGWVRIALNNAFFQLQHAPSFRDGVIATVRCGGDTDTNAAVAGALLGAVYGREAVPLQWRRMVLSCRPQRGATHPRPAKYWGVDVLPVAERLLLAGRTARG